jgi:hypothetical protein
METKKSIGSKVFWIIAGCVLVILMFFPLFVGGKRMYSEFRAYTSDSYEGQIAHADHSLNYGDKMGRPKSALFLERGYAKSQLPKAKKISSRAWQITKVRRKHLPIFTSQPSTPS